MWTPGGALRGPDIHPGKGWTVPGVDQPEQVQSAGHVNHAFEASSTLGTSGLVGREVEIGGNQSDAKPEDCQAVKMAPGEAANGDGERAAAGAGVAAPAGRAVGEAVRAGPGQWIRRPAPFALCCAPRSR